MLKEMAEYAVRRGASQATLNKVFYARFRAEYPWLPTRLIEGAYRDAVRRAKSFRDAKKRGKAYTEAPEVRRVDLTFSDAQDWRLEDGALKLRIGGGEWCSAVSATNNCVDISTAGGGWRRSLD